METLSLRESVHLSILRTTNKWQPSESSEFFVPETDDECNQIRQWIHSLPDGSLLPVRGRDNARNDTGEILHFTPWEFGILSKMKRRIFLLWSETVESYLIDGCDFSNLLHIECSRPAAPEDAPVNKKLTVILSHGFSEVDGPDYPLICTMRIFLRYQGYDVITPDFRSRCAIVHLHHQNKWLLY